MKFKHTIENGMVSLNGINTYIRMVRKNPSQHLNSCTGFNEIWTDSAGPMQRSKIVASEPLCHWVYSGNTRPYYKTYGYRFYWILAPVGGIYAKLEYLGDTDFSYEVVS